jgi:hypothetical protein
MQEVGKDVYVTPNNVGYGCYETKHLNLGRGIGDELVTHPEESYRLWYMHVCDLETL